MNNKVDRKIPILTQEEADKRIYEALYPKMKKLDIKKTLGGMEPAIPMSQPVVQNQPRQSIGRANIPNKPINNVKQG